MITSAHLNDNQKACQLAIFEMNIIVESIAAGVEWLRRRPAASEMVGELASIHALCAELREDLSEIEGRLQVEFRLIDETPEAAND